MRVEITYDTVKASAKRRGQCPGCGATVTRSRTFEQTVNPFNRNAAGLPKTSQEVAASVSEQAQAWDPEPEVFRHGRC